MSVELSGFTELSSVFAAAPQKLLTESKKVVSKTALETKKGAQARISAQLRPSYLPHYARSIDYDLKDAGLSAEVGPNPDKIQGPFGRGVEFGSSHTGPLPHLLPAADEQEPKFFQAMGDAAKAAL